MKPDPLQLLFYNYKPDISLINKIIFGKRQVVVLFNDNNLGSCTTLGNEIFAEKGNLLCPDFKNISHRALLIAYYNALYNNSNKSDGHFDITEIIDFRKYNKLVIIGFFRTLVEKLDANYISSHVFDLHIANERITNIQFQNKCISVADAIIVTATTLLNNTFTNIIENTNSNCDVFLLGPTSILSKQLFFYPNLKYIFGTVYEDTEKVLKIIEKGGGIKDISSFMKKTYMKRPENLF
ncbi:MAG: Rossmann-like domain-containing protein [Bacteroidales bacterium]